MSTSGRLPALDVVLTGGGTAGHIVPALALAEELVERGHPVERLHFVGTRRGMEADLVPAAGFSITLLPGRGFQRRLTLDNLQSVREMASAIASSLRLVRRRRPKVVVTFGGYAGLPAASAAALLRVPLLVVSVDAAAGVSNRLAARFATAIALAFPDERLPGGVVTGAPLRQEVLTVTRLPEEVSALRRELAIGANPKVLVVVGGSLGADRLNRGALGLLERFGDDADLVLVHVTGHRNFDAVARARADLARVAPRVDYRPLAYTDDLAKLYAIATLVIARAGAMTVAELAAIGTPSILVPLPRAPRDHQRKNAAMLERAGGAIVLDDEQATPERLFELSSSLLADGLRLAAMERAAHSVGRRDATERIAALAESLARSGSDEV